LYGLPGTGKSTLSSIIIDYVEKNIEHPNEALAYVYVDWRAKTTAIDVLLSICQQLASQCLELPWQLIKLHSQLRVDERHPDIDEVMLLNVAMCDAFSRTFIVIDAVEEVDYASRESLLAKLQWMRNHGARVLVSSGTHGDRPEPCGCYEDLEIALKNEDQRLIRPRTEDLEAFASKKLFELDNWTALLRQTGVYPDQFAQRVAADSGGVFRVMDLQIKRAGRRFDEGQIPSHLRPGLPDEHWMHFLEQYADLAEQPDARWTLAERMLNWVVHAVVPLKIKELCHAAIAMRLSESEDYRFDVLDNDALVTFREENDTEDTTMSIIKLCNNLISVTDDQHVRLWVDYTFNERQQRDLFSRGHYEIATTCLSMLGEPKLVAQNHFPFIASLEPIAPAWNYFEKHWAAHYEACTTDVELDVLAMIYLDRVHKQPNRWIETRKPFFDKAYEVVVTDDESPILKVARLGLNGLLRTLIASDRYDINAESWKKETALSVAVTTQRHSTAQILYQYGASIHHTNKHGQSLLHPAVEMDDEIMTFLLLNSGLPVDTPDKQDFKTPIQIAAEKNAVRSGRILLEAQADTKDALQAAAGAGAFEFVKLLVEYDEKLSIAVDRGLRSSALHAAVRSGSVPLVEYLIAHGADANSVSSRGETAVHAAGSQGNLDVIKVLVDHGADPFLVDDGANEVCEGDSAISSAVRNGHEETIQFLLARLNPGVSGDALLRTAIAAVDAETPNLQVLDVVLSRLPQDVEHYRKDIRHTLLGAAVSCENERILLKLLAHGIPIGTRDKQGWTALHHAAHIQSEVPLRILLEHGANPNEMSNSGMSPLHIAAYHGSTNIITLLLNHGALVDLKASDRSTPLVAAAYNRQQDAIKLLLEHKASINDPNTNGETIVHHAVMDDDFKLLEDIFKYNPDLELQSWRAGSPLHHAAFKGSINIMKLLISHGANIDQGFEYHGGRYVPPNERGFEDELSWHTGGRTDKNRPHDNWSTIESGWTPLHSAVCGGHVEAVEFLLLNGAKASLPAEGEETALHIAASACFTGIVELLIQHGADISRVTSAGDTPMHSVASASIATKNTHMVNRYKCACTLRHEEEEKQGHEDHSKSDCVAALLRLGANLDDQNKLGFTPLALAVQAGNEYVVNAILSHASKSSRNLSEAAYLKLLQDCSPEANAKVLRIVTEVTTETAESKAAWYELLCKACPGGNEELVALAIERGAIWRRKSWEGANPFLEAVRHEKLETVKLLLEAGAQPDEADEHGCDALHLACRANPNEAIMGLLPTLTVNYSDTSKYLIVRELLLHSARKDSRTHSGDTPLHFAVVAGDLNIVKGLVGLGASVNTRNKRGETPLHAAVSTWVFPNIVEHLLLKHACASAQDLAGFTPLHRIRDRRAEGERILELLLKHGGDASIRARNGDMAHHSAFKRGNLMIARRLMESGEFVNAKGFKGRTVLHIAARKHRGVIDSLVKMGADWNLRDDFGRTPQDYLT
jgi:ankyrin repeat protein